MRNQPTYRASERSDVTSIRLDHPPRRGASPARLNRRDSAGKVVATMLVSLFPCLSLAAPILLPAISRYCDGESVCSSGAEVVSSLHQGGPIIRGDRSQKLLLKAVGYGMAFRAGRPSIDKLA